MGAWSHEPFGNDTACDWAYGLEGQADFSLVATAIQNVLDNGNEYLDSDVACEAIAAAEVLAKALGRGIQSDAYTEAVDAWLNSLAVQPRLTCLPGRTQHSPASWLRIPNSGSCGRKAMTLPRGKLRSRRCKRQWAASDSGKPTMLRSVGLVHAFTHRRRPTTAPAAPATRAPRRARRRWHRFPP